MSELALHTAATLARLFTAVFLAFAVSVPAAVAVGRKRLLSAALSPLAEMLSAVPKISLFPLIVLICGLNDRSRILTVFLVVFFQIFISVSDAVRNIPAAYVSSIDSLGAGRIHRLRYLYLPAAAPRLFTSLRTAVTAAFAVLFFTEISITKGFGLGRLVTERWSALDYLSMYIAAAVTAAAGFAIFLLSGRIESRVCRWRCSSGRCSARQKP